MAVAYVSATTCALVTALGFKNFVATVCSAVEIICILHCSLKNVCILYVHFPSNSQVTILWEDINECIIIAIFIIIIIII